MAELTHAQNGEDTILLNFFGDQQRGTFVDVGAFDGVTFSNTYLLERRGWEGVCIEPNPTSFERCSINRACTCLQAAVVGNARQRTATLRVPTMDVLATLADDHDGDIEIIHRNVNAAYNGFREISVPAVTLNTVLNKLDFTQIDLLSIDAEWTNADVLAGFDMWRWLPRVIVVETGQGVRDALTGYHVVMEHGSNFFAVRDSADVSRMVDAYRSMQAA